MILMILNAGNGFTQSIPAFKSLRYDENYSFLENDSNTNGYRKLKYHRLGNCNHSFISYGGEWRQQYFYTKNESWGDAPDDKNGYLLTRTLLHADLHASNHFRSFVQLQSSLAGSRIDAGPLDDNPLEIHQAFADWNWQTGNVNMIIRAGRQELLYGSQRLIAVREGPNHRLSFDAFKLITYTAQAKLDVFYGHPVAARKEIFNDGFNKQAKLWGAYFVQQSSNNSITIDAYYLGLWKQYWKFNDGEGKELRHSMGSRISNGNRNWKYDMEALVQFGKFENKNIFAWTASINTSYKFRNGWLAPEIGLKTELISGDKQPGDDKLQTFNPLFPRGAYFGLAALIGPANLVDLHPSITLTVTKNWSIAFDYDVFWRYSSMDGLYGVNAALIYSSAGSKNKYIGQQPAFNTTYTLNNFVTFTGEFTWFDAGPYLKDAGTGKDILFTGITTQLKF